MKKLFLAGIAALFLATGTACNDQPKDAWSRRVECVQIGKKKLAKELVHYKGRDQANYDWQVSVRTRYASDTGHCYIVIEGYANTGLTFSQASVGLTDEHLAQATWIRENREEGKKDVFFGEVTEGGYVHELVPLRHIETQEDYEMYLREQYAAAMKYINDLMTEKR